MRLTYFSNQQFLGHIASDDRASWFLAAVWPFGRPVARHRNEVAQTWRAGRCQLGYRARRLRVGVITSQPTTARCIYRRRRTTVPRYTIITMAGLLPPPRATPWCYCRGIARRRVTVGCLYRGRPYHTTVRDVVLL